MSKTPDPQAMTVPTPPLSESAVVPYEKPEDIVIEIKRRAFRKVHGLLAEPGSPEYNTDGDFKRSECPMRTTAAVELVGALLRSNPTVHHNVTIRTISLPEKRPAIDVDVVEVVKREGE